MKVKDVYFIALAIGAIVSYILGKVVDYMFVVPQFIFTLLMTIEWFNDFKGRYKI